jgi:hypothetical protein
MPRKKVKQEGELLDTLGVKLSPELVREIEEIGAELDRSKSWVGRKLILRGLSAYRRDGRFEEERAKQAGSKAPLEPKQKSA